MKYNRKLIGKNMGQFHTDFCLNDKNGKPCKDITAVACVFNGKKCYIDKKGIWTFEIPDSFYTWYHQISGQGFIA